MRKSNEQLQRDVLDELRWDPQVQPGAVGVAAADGVVSLSGQVTLPAQRLAAVRAAERVPGVRAIADNVVVNVPGSLRQTDTDIACQVALALGADGDVPESVKARVDNRWVCLEGNADWPFQAAAAERAVRGHAAGVRGVTNNIVISHPAPLPAVPVHRVCLTP